MRKSRIGGANWAWWLAWSVACLLLLATMLVMQVRGQKREEQASSIQAEGSKKVSASRPAGPSGNGILGTLTFQMDHAQEAREDGDVRVIVNRVKGGKKSVDGVAWTSIPEHEKSIVVTATLIPETTKVVGIILGRSGGPQRAITAQIGANSKEAVIGQYDAAGALLKEDKNGGFENPKDPVELAVDFEKKTVSLTGANGFAIHSALQADLPSIDTVGFYARNTSSDQTRSFRIKSVNIAGE